MRRGVGIDAAGAHEAHRLGDAVGERMVARPGRRILQETKRPFVDMFEIGIPPLREGAQQIERCRRLPVGHDLALRIGLAAGEIGRRIIDDIAAIDRQFLAIDGLEGRRAGFRKLAGNAADLHNRLAAGEGQDHRHLQEDAEEIADIVGRMFSEAFGAIAALEQESLALGDARELALELACLACKNQWRVACELGFDVGQALAILIGRQLLGRLFAPALRSPGRCCGLH